MVTHFGTVRFAGGSYERVSGSANWSVEPVGGLPLGQVRIVLEEVPAEDYSVIVTAQRTGNTPLLGANYGDRDETGFVVHLWETVADRTVVNGGFSFAVLGGED